MNIDQTRKVFRELKPCCVELSKVAFLSQEALVNHDPKSLTKLLENVYNELDNQQNLYPNLELSAQLTDYIFQPIGVLLGHDDRALQEVHLQMIFKILEILVRRGWSTDRSDGMNEKIATLILFVIGKDPLLYKGKITRDDELLLSAYNCLSTCLDNMINLNDDSLLHNVGKLSHLILVSLDALNQKHSNSQLSVTILISLNKICVLVYQGDQLARILPGIVSSLVKTIKSPVHYEVLLECLNLLSFLVERTFNDLNLHVTHPLDNLKLQDLEGFDNKLVVNQMGEGNRNTDWLEVTVKQLYQSLKTISPVILTHHKPQVTLAWLEFVQAVIEKCPISLGTLIPFLIDSLLQLFPTHYETCSRILSLNRYLVQDTLNDLILSKIQEIPSKLNTVDEQQKRIFLKQLSSLIHYVDQPPPALLQGLQNEFFKYLIGQRKKFSAPVKTIQEISVSLTLEADSSQLASLVPYEHDLKSLLLSLGQILPDSAVQSLITEFTPMNNINHVLDKSVSVWMTSEMLLGRSMQDEVSELVKFDESSRDDSMKYLILETANELIDSCDLNTPITQSKKNTLLLNLKAINNIIDIMGSEFTEELVGSLYPIFELLTAQDIAVRTSARYVVENIASKCYNGSLVDLVYKNIDYLIDGVSSRLNSEITPYTSSILMVLIEIGGVDILDQLGDLISTMFTLLDYYHGYTVLCEQFFEVFHKLVDQSSVLMRGYTFSEEKQTNTIWRMKDREAMGEFLTKYWATVQRTKIDIPDTLEELTSHPNKPFGDLDSDKDSDDEEELDINGIQSEPEVEAREVVKEWKSPFTPDVYFMFQTMLQYGDRLVMHDSVRLRIQIISLWNKIFPILSTSIDDMYPVISDLWPKVAEFILQEKEMRLMIPTLELATTIIQYGGQFCCKRFIDLWESLSKKKLLAQIHKKHTLPEFEEKIYYRLMEFLVFSLERLGTGVPSEISMNIIKYTITRIDDESKYGSVHDDIVWYLKQDASVVGDNLLTS
ncbi:ASTRA complex subunit [Komagataella phaffii CBS 7435]|uniref:Uncharacterized protein n=2 Tax=Komagataella phaffii TaxID=460519 RepID=C4QW13_KOMPG|nr:uncharacterized protein PAS_chr1-1_0077 [Komagataella phaffii GS115]AOA66278.1 GQ68_02604T0 [Komagataella phaffii GS115]CAH2446102.1 Putative Tti1 protein [Komagataella phaffii CBS 7435]CAY67436.1 Putative protein of unknown function [Komagataella phaffii GS115]CCA36536.1 ASTRA complex subunit [Komagataella phaffii CBS 7435]